MADNKRSAMDVKESLEAAKFIVKYAKDVKIDSEKLNYFTKSFIQFWSDEIMNTYRTLLHSFFRPDKYPDFTEETVDWLFVFHTLNFSLFNRKGTMQWQAGDSDGYNALSFAINRAIEEGKPLWDPKYYSKLTQSELEHIFRSDDGKTTIPLLNERLMILHEVGNVLLEKYEGTFKNCIKSANYNPDYLVKLLFNEFEPYRDEAEYKHKTVRLYTKANSLVSDIWACYKRRNMFHLNKENMMSTILIDYRSPMALYLFEILTYSENLKKTFRNSDQPFKHGDKEELELRACCLVAVNKIVKQIETEWRNKYPEYDRQNISILIDNFLLLRIIDDVHKYVYRYDQHPMHYITSVHY